MNIQDLLIQATQFLSKTSGSARLDAEIIISEVLNCRREDLIIRSKNQLQPKELSACLQQIERRIQGEPVAYITNKKEFLNHEFFIQKGVLVPRPETELLVEYVLHWIENINKKINLWLLDIGCGSGNIHLSLLKEVSNLKAVAVDISKVAIETTKINSSKLGVQDRVFIYEQDADHTQLDSFGSIKPSPYFDIIVSNPPYIARGDTEVQKSVLDHEPHEALFCDDNGLEKIRKWTLLASVFLNEGGLWAFEIGYKQGELAKKILREIESFEKIEIVKDYSGKDRFIFTTKRRTNKKNFKS